MLIYLNASISQLETADEQEIGQLFSELLRASTNGFHIILMNRKICTWARQNLDLNPREMARLEWLKEKFTQRGSLLSEARCSIEIQIGGPQLQEHSPNTYRIGHRFFLTANYFDPARLLVEHIENDGKFIEIILNEMRKQHPVKAFKLQLQNGGGTAITACLRTEIPHRTIVVSIVDSDKVAPCAPSSATKRNMDNQAARQTYVGIVCETPCKEIENYIPMEILRANKQKFCPDFPHFDLLEKLISEQVIGEVSDCLWLYFDLKKGVEAEKLNSIQIPAVVDWLDMKFQLDGHSFQEKEIEGFGDGILGQFLGCGEAITEFKKFMRTPYWNMHFESFFDLIYWYFASEKKRATV